jgi:hypothetical protein
MRTKTLLLTAALSVAGIATSMAQAVYSVNAVGYVNTDLVPGFNLISNPLDNKAPGGNQIVNLFTTGLQGPIPQAFTVYHFNPVTDDFEQTSYDDIDQAFSGDATNVEIKPGTGMFVFVPQAAGNKRVTFVGEVPQGLASDITIPEGFSIKASTVPIAGTVTSMGFPAAQGDTIYEWDKAAQNYVSASYDDIEQTWLRNNQPAVPQIDVGEAFFVFKRAQAAWTRNFTVNQ